MREYKNSLSEFSLYVIFEEKSHVASSRRILISTGSWNAYCIFGNEMKPLLKGGFRKNTNSLKNTTFHLFINIYFRNINIFLI